ncbi:hypothetical protein PG985_013113 [Apiospora marii]|uniref:uncharacterized protein n=1 Tax=Apiospora marii TaxID=335849 RepID=UPI003132475D
MFEAPPLADHSWPNRYDLATHVSPRLPQQHARLHRPATTYDLLYEIAAEAEKARRLQENENLAQRTDMKQ